MLTSVAAYSYAIAAAGFVLLSVLLLTTWRGRMHGVTLTLACVVTAAWAALLALQADSATPWTRLTDSLETVRNGAWSYFLVLLLGHFRKPASALPFQLRPSLLVAAVLYLLYLAANASGWMHLEFLTDLGLMPGVVGHVGMAVFGMLLVEQLYRNKPMPERWALKFACLGIGGMFAYDFYMYSDAMLFHKVNPDIWAARGVVNALSVPLLGISIARSTSWSSAISLSRRVMFHSAALFGSAIYLLAMGSAGYYLRFFGGSWGTVMQVTFLCGALVLLAGILFSGTFRSWLKVSISKHFYSYNYDYREEWLRFTRTLSEQGPGLGERTIQAVAALVESPGGALWVRRESGLCEPDAQWHVPVTAISEPADSAFCAYLERSQWVIDLQEYAREPEKYADVALPAWLLAYPRAWLVVPLIMHAKLLGFVLLQQPRSSINLNWEVIDLLKIAGSQAASYLAQQDAANALMVARQFESFNRMSTFVVHDLKNLVAQLSLLIPNAEKHRNNPEFQRDMLDTVNHSVHKMKLLLQKLSRNDAPERPLPLAIDKLVRQAVSLKTGFEPLPLLQVQDQGLKVVADWERLERVLGHLIQNAIEATPRDGEVQIRLRRDGVGAVIEIADTGEGMSEEFIRERLFKPFETTKSAGMGIGVFESLEYINELGGKLEVRSLPAEGTTFTIILPLYQVEAAIAETAA